VGKIVLRLRLLSLALSITEYIAALRRLIRVGAGELIILGADHDAELRALDRVVLSSTNRPLSKQRISAV